MLGRTKRRRPPKERGPKPKQRETNDMRNVLLLWIQVTIGSQEPIVRKAIFGFHRTVATIIMICVIIDCIVTQLKLVGRKNLKAFPNQEEPARGIPKMFDFSTSLPRLMRMDPRTSAGFHWSISAHGEIVPMGY